MAANQAIVRYLQPHLDAPLRADNLWIKVPGNLLAQQLDQAIEPSRQHSGPPSWDLREAAADLLKFSDLLPQDLLAELILSRIGDVPLARSILEYGIRMVDG